LTFYGGSGDLDPIHNRWMVNSAHNVLLPQYCRSPLTKMLRWQKTVVRNSCRRSSTHRLAHAVYMEHDDEGVSFCQIMDGLDDEVDEAEGPK